MNLFLERTRDKILNKEVKETDNNKESVRKNQENIISNTKKTEENESKPNKKNSFGLNKTIFPDFSKDNSAPTINSLFKLIPTFNINKKNEEEAQDEKEDVIVLDNTDESLLLYQQKMIDLKDENKLLKDKIQEYVSNVAWLEESFTQRQENANNQHLQELEHIRKTNEKEANLYNEKIKELEDEVSVLQNELTRQTDLLADEKDTLLFTTDANWNLENKISQLEDDLKKKNAESIDLKANLIDVSTKLDDTNQKYLCLQEEFQRLKTELENTIEKNEKLKKDNVLLSEKIKIYDNISKRTSLSSESSLKYKSNLDDFGKFYSSSNNTTNGKINHYKHTSSEYSYTLYPTSELKNKINEKESDTHNDISLISEEEIKNTNSDTETMNNIKNEDIQEEILKINKNDDGSREINELLKDIDLESGLTTHSPKDEKDQHLPDPIELPEDLNINKLRILSKSKSISSINTMTEIQLD